MDTNLKDIRSLRLATGMRLKDLAKQAQVSQSELKKCERGLIVPNDIFFSTVANVLGVSPTDLMQTHHDLLQKIALGEGYTTATPQGDFMIKRRAEPSADKFRVIDLFCGTGGFSHGFALTGRFAITAGIDLLPDRVSTFCKNHETAIGICKDIREVNIETIREAEPKPDVIIGGPPCQGFSSIRPFRTLTEKDLRNNLFEYFVLVVSTLRPKWFVLENVVGLLTHEKGKTLKRIISLFEEAGYKTEQKILNAAMYGLPQRRERMILIGNNTDKQIHWPEPTHFLNSRSMAGTNGQKLSMVDMPPAITIMEAIHDLPEIPASGSAQFYEEDIIPTPYERAMRGNEKILTLHKATNHTERMLEIIRQAGSNRDALPEGLTTSGFSTSYSRLEPDLPSVTLTVNFVHPASNKCIHPYQNRALTPREGARLQGFEDSYIFTGTRTKIVKQIGNAVPPIFGKVIAEALLEQL